MSEIVFPFHMNDLTADGVHYVARCLADIVRIDDVVKISGDLGVGKTFFASEFIKTVLKDHSIVVNSPTFNIFKEYKNNSISVMHFDLYRIESIDELYRIGIPDIMYDKISIIEWPEKIQSILLNDSRVFEINITFSSNNLRNLYGNCT